MFYLFLLTHFERDEENAHLPSAKSLSSCHMELVKYAESLNLTNEARLSSKNLFVIIEKSAFRTTNL